MKKILKRFKLSEWLILSQILLSGGTLLLTVFMGDGIIDLVGLIGNMINGIVLIVVFFFENTKSVRSHELMGQFIFNQVGENFSAFMDFVMSDAYDRTSLDERNILHSKLVEMAAGDDYEIKRKLSRAIPYIFDIDKGMATDIIEILRGDLYNDRTDIRRRTLEAVLTIIQRQPVLKKQRRYAKKFFDLFAYRKFDDAYTIVACIECYFSIYEFVVAPKDKKQCLESFEELKQSAVRAHDLGIGYIDDSIVGDMDHIWQVLVALSSLQDIRRADYAESKRLIDETLATGGKFSKLSVVKNLYYSCEGFPECLCGHKCTVASSKYMMSKIHGFLTDAIDNDVFLVMPTVRYFDCVCNNVCKNEAKSVAREIIRGYFSSDQLLIAQTAFDKFAKLVKVDSAFAGEVLADLISMENGYSALQSEAILKKIAALSEEERACFATESSRLKLKTTAEYERRLVAREAVSDEAKEVHDLIDSYNKRIRFIGKIKKFKEDHQL